MSDQTLAAGFIDTTLPTIESIDSVRHLVAAHRAISALDSALRFVDPLVSAAFHEMVWLLDGLAAVQLDGDPVWLQSIFDDPSGSGVERVMTYASVAKQLSASRRSTEVTRQMALDIAERVGDDGSSAEITLRRDSNSNEALQHGLAHWEHFVSDRATGLDPLVMVAIADAKLRRLSPFTASNHATASLLLNALLRDEQVLHHSTLCLSSFFSRHSDDFYEALPDDEAVVRFYLRAYTNIATSLVQSLEHLQKHIAHCQKLVDDTLTRAPLELVVPVVCQPYCSNADLVDVGITRRQTCSSYLKKLSEVGMLTAHQNGKELRYVNTGVLDAFKRFG